MSPTRTASAAPRKPARRHGRGADMAIDLRGARRRRERADGHGWQDSLIPAGVLAVLGYITAYHHVLLLETIRAWL